MIVLVRHGINGNRLRVREKMNLIVFHSDSNHLYQRLLAISNQ